MHRQHQILVVDDEADVRVMLRMRLGLEGWVISERASGDEAISFCRESAPDLVVLDHRMPGLTGIETAQRLRDCIFHGPIILFSGYLEPDVEREAARLGVTTMEKSESVHLADQIRMELGSS